MEHTEIISNAFKYTKEGFLDPRNIPRWLTILLYITIPMAIGFLVSNIILQLAILPVLSDLLVGDEFGFTVNGLSHILFVISIAIGALCFILVPFGHGFVYRMIKNNDRMPGCANPWGLFFSGWRINLVIFKYIIPIIVISIIYFAVFLFLFTKFELFSAVSAPSIFSGILYNLLMFTFAAMEFITMILVSLFALVGMVHLVRSGSIKEASSFRTTGKIIKKIGWYDYILSLVIMSIAFLSVSFVFTIIASSISFNIAGIALLSVIYIFVMIPIISVFVRYITQVYDSAFIEPENDSEDFDDF